MTLEERFQKAFKNLGDLIKTPPDEDLRLAYGLYKQAQFGDCSSEKPGFLDFKGRKKWDAWDSQRGISQDSAKEQYIALVNTLIESCGLKT